METAWKWLLRFMYTVVLLLVIALLSLAVITVPRIWGVVEKFGDAAEAVERSARSIEDLMEKAEETLED
jgi:hypothetical protein